MSNQTKNDTKKFPFVIIKKKENNNGRSTHNRPHS